MLDKAISHHTDLRRCPAICIEYVLPFHGKNSLAECQRPFQTKLLRLTIITEMHETHPATIVRLQSLPYPSSLSRGKKMVKGSRKWNARRMNLLALPCNLFLLFDPPLTVTTLQVESPPIDLGVARNGLGRSVTSGVSFSQSLSAASRSLRASFLSSAFLVKI
jgi:hypothetical protein